MRNISNTALSLVLLWLVMPAQQARADAGAVRVSERRGNRQITVFTDPTPLRAGPVDVSVLVQDTQTGLVTVRDSIHVSLAPQGSEAPATRRPASRENASNKLFQAAHLEISSAGWWQVIVEVAGPDEGAAVERIVFEVEAAPPLPPWQALWPWFCWPFAAIAVFAGLQATSKSAMRVRS